MRVNRHQNRPPESSYHTLDRATATLATVKPQVGAAQLLPTNAAPPTEHRQAVAADLYNIFHTAQQGAGQLPPPTDAPPRGQVKPPPPTRQALQTWRDAPENAIPEWFGRMTQFHYDTLLAATPPPRRKPPLHHHISNNFETEFDPFNPTSCTTGLVGPPPVLLYCQDRVQAAWEAFVFHETHDKFGRLHAGQPPPESTSRIIIPHSRPGNCNPGYSQTTGRQTSWTRLIEVGGVAEGPESKVLFGTNLSGLATMASYNDLHDWLTSFEGVMQCIIGCQSQHGQAHFHVHMESHGKARDFKMWFDNNKQSTLLLRHAPYSKLEIKFSNLVPEGAPAVVKMSADDPWNHPVVRVSWDPSVIHPYPPPLPPNSSFHNPQAWNDWYLRHCGLTQAPTDSLGAEGTHQARWNDPSVPRGRSLSRTRQRSQSPAASRGARRR